MSIEGKLYGQGLLGEIKPDLRGMMMKRWLVPPFSVLNARDGFWQERKRAWLRLGIQGELGRNDDGGDVYNSGSPGDLGKQYGGICGRIGPTINTREGDRWEGGRGSCQNAGTSIFDPVLCEVIYRWFCPKEGHILDPFAGGSTRGIVATTLGYGYTGVELRRKQVEANEQQASKIGVRPTWLIGDSSHIDDLLPKGRMFDLVFSGPPYYDLEVYSSKREDGSAKPTYSQFMTWYVKVFQQCVRRLRVNRFLVVAVGEVRDKRGIYRNFVGDNVRCFVKYCGLEYYNEIILVTAIGSLPIRAGRQFSRGRKVGKTHQNILVFYKGDPRAIKDHFPKEAYGLDPVVNGDRDIV